MSTVPYFLKVELDNPEECHGCPAFSEVPHSLRLPYDCSYLGGRNTAARPETCPLQLDSSLSNTGVLFDWARRVNGDESQIDKAIEECAELIGALVQHRQKRVSYEAVVDEIADVTIMAAQMRLMFGECAVDVRLKEKLKRLSERVLPRVEGVDQ